VKKAKGGFVARCERNLYEDPTRSLEPESEVKDFFISPIERSF
jgi:hypothetical protein